MKKFFSDFKKFITRGNIIDMAIGVIVGGAFNTIVKSLTDKIIMPLINYLLSLGGDGLESAVTFLKKVTDPTTKEVIWDSSIYIDWGAFITAILNFLIIAFTLFIVIKVAAKSRELFNEATETAKKYTLTKEDRKELKKRGVKRCNKKAIDEYRAEQARLAQEAKEKADAEAKAKAEADRLANPTQEDLLKEIRDLLKQQASQKQSAKKTKSDK